MKLAGAFHKPDFLKLMNRAIDEARADLRASGRDDGPDAQRVMVLRLVASVSAGERNLGRLKLAALEAADAGAGSRRGSKPQD